jgi:rod shape determining protein RodA
MFSWFQKASKVTKIDWILVGALLPILAAGLVTMNSFVGDNDYFQKQLIWIVISLAVFFGFSFIDFQFLRKRSILVSIYTFIVIALGALFVIGTVTKGAQSWFRIGGFSLQPVDPAKLALVLILAKYFSRRHVEIANVRHIIVSGIYAFILFGLVALQPDFGGAIIIFAIWLGMVLVSGISKKHLLAVFLIGATAFGFLWTAVFMTFIHPLADIRGTGYNAYQSTITVGSGQIWGKGVGYGTQSRLKFLPEYQTDFIFAAYAEEWGFAGVILLFTLYGIVIWRILANALRGATNFEILYGLGVAVWFMAHIMIHIGMNIGLLPVTGLTIPFMSYGGSHLLTTFAALGILMGMRRYARAAHKDITKNEFLI